MSDTLADLTYWFPSEFFTAEDIPINKTQFPNNHHSPHRYPYDFGSSSSTDSESDDDDHFAGLTQRFTRSISLQERLKISYPVQKKRVFSSLPESPLNWNVSSPATPLAHSDEYSWERIYAAAGQIARMKMKMNMINTNDHVFANRSLLPQRSHGPPPNLHHHHLNCSNWIHENEEFIRQHQFHHRHNYGGGGGRCGKGLPVGFRHSAWPPQVENPRPQQPANAFAIKNVLAGSGGGCGRVTAGVKKECVGTGVFFPRTSYSHGPPESKKKQACSGGHLPARVVAQSFNKTMDPINPQPQPNIYSGYAPHHQVPPHHLNRAELAEIVIARRHAAMLVQQRRSTNLVGVPERQIGGHPEVVLPQDWSY